MGDVSRGFFSRRIPVNLFPSHLPYGGGDDNIVDNSHLTANLHAALSPSSPSSSSLPYSLIFDVFYVSLKFLCSESFTPNGPTSEEAVERVRAILDDLKPANVSLDQEAQAAQKWRAAIGCNGKKSRKGSQQCPPPIKYLHIHECENFSIGIFCMPPSSIIPLHNHPGMTVLSKVLYGSLHVKSYDWLDVPGSFSQTEARPAKLVRDCEMTAPCGTTVLYPTTGGNIHTFKAITPCAIFDILTPPYSSEDGRHCSYFRKTNTRELPEIEQLQGLNLDDVIWLEESQPPENFMVLRDQYKGPLLLLETATEAMEFSVATSTPGKWIV
ncbi:hypothetical protein V2J09_017025 [Rumex salicifolius]